MERLLIPDSRELAPSDAVWSVSTAKPGSGVQQLLDSDSMTFWQSDGAQPHLINIQFHRKTKLKEVALYCDFKHDESYTPSKLSVRAGTHFHDLQEIREVDIEEPNGWILIPLARPVAAADEIQGPRDECIQVFTLQIAILQNHQNGRDSHVRQVKLFGPREAPFGSLMPVMSSSSQMESFSFVR